MHEPAQRRPGLIGRFLDSFNTPTGRGLVGFAGVVGAIVAVLAFVFPPSPGKPSAESAASEATDATRSDSPAAAAPLSQTGPVADAAPATRQPTLTPPQASAAVPVSESAAPAAKEPSSLSSPVVASPAKPAGTNRTPPSALRPIDPGSESGPRWDVPSQGIIEDERPQTAAYLASMSFAGQGAACRPRISHKYGDAFGTVSDAMLVQGNQSCVQATYGDMMTLTVETCGGQLTEIQQIQVERGAFRDDGRAWTAPASLSYTLIANGRETPPIQLGTGGYARVQRATFAPVLASAVKIILRSPRTRAYPIYQRLCSVIIR